MNQLPLILAAAAVTYVLRLAGFVPLRWGAAAAVESLLRYVPVAVFAALLAPGIGGGGEVLPRLAGAVAAIVIVLRVPKLWAALAGGMGMYWMARGLW
jgi:branched-subunit amino acid transport protein